MNSFLTSIPYELIQYIYSYLVMPKDSLRFSSSCRYIHTLLLDEIIHIHKMLSLLHPNVQLINRIKYNTIGNTSHRDNIRYAYRQVQYGLVPVNELCMYRDDDYKGSIYETPLTIYNNFSGNCYNWHV